MILPLFRCNNSLVYVSYSRTRSTSCPKKTKSYCRDKRYELYASRCMRKIKSYSHTKERRI